MNVDMPSNFVIRQMARGEIELAIEWAAREGWNPGLHDADPFFAADPSGFFMGELDGQPVGCISAVAYDATYGFLGFYLVRPEFRGRGFGLQLWHAAMERLGDRNIGLDGVVAQQANYAKSGFQFAYNNSRFQGVTIADGRPRPDSLVDLASVPLAQIADYDRALFPAPRADFLQRWICPPSGHTLGVVEGSQLVGYGVIRACRVGFKVGPLFADHEAIAETLFQGLAEHASGGPIFLDIPEVNPAAIRLATRYQMEKVFETARMYTSGEPELPLHRMYGVTSFELG